jgi:bifunctional DNase/RNase
MVQVAVTIDAVRQAGLRDLWALILREKVSEECPAVARYLPIWISQPQADIITGELIQRPNKSRAPDDFLAGINTTESGVKSTTIHLKDETFYATLQFSHHGAIQEVECPIAVAVALAFKARASILVGECTWDKAALTVNPEWRIGVGRLVPATDKAQ